MAEESKSDPGPETEDPVVSLIRALDLTLASLQLAQDALDANPSPDNEIRLSRRVLDLERRAAMQQAQLDAMTADTEVVGPSRAQVERMAELTAKVEKATNDALAASAVLALTGDVLGLMTDIAARTA